MHEALRTNALYELDKNTSQKRNCLNFIRIGNDEKETSSSSIYY